MGCSGGIAIRKSPKTDRSRKEQRVATYEICAKINQAATGTKDVSKNISSVTMDAQETSSGASQVLEAAQELSKQSEALQRSVESFLVSVRAG